MLEPDQTPVVGVARQMIDVADEMPDALGRSLGDHKLLRTFVGKTATTQILWYDGQYSRDTLAQQNE